VLNTTSHGSLWLMLSKLSAFKTSVDCSSSMPALDSVTWQVQEHTRTFKCHPMDFYATGHRDKLWDFAMWATRVFSLALI
jgi:hypothetical protein